MTYTNFNLVEKNPQAIITQNTSAQVTSNSANTYITINGSEITYTPVAGSSNVVYEIGFYVEALNQIVFEHIVLEQNTGTWAMIDNKFGKNFGFSGSSNQYLRDYLYYRFIIPSWPGSRQLRLRSASSQNNYPATYHQMTTWDGAGSVSNRFCNTSLLVYSV